jgi:hypothetical protein
MQEVEVRCSEAKGGEDHSRRNDPVPLPCLRRSSKKKPPVENGPQELEDLDDLGDLNEDPNEGRFDVDEWFPQDRSNDRD